MSDEEKYVLKRMQKISHQYDGAEAEFIGNIR